MIGQLDISELNVEVLREFCDRYGDNPELFAKEILGVDFDYNQGKIADLVRCNKLVSVASCLGSGKSYLAACLALWFFSTNSKAKVIVTANTGAQLSKTLFPYVQQLARTSAIKSWFDITATKITLRGSPEAGFISALIWSRENPDAARGNHAENMLIVCDEASGIDDIILSNFRSTLTQSNNKMLMISNPSRTAGYFYDSFKANTLGHWSNWHINAESSNWTSKENCENLKATYGEDSDIYRVNVLGLFPLNSSSTVLSEKDMECMLKAPSEFNQSVQTVIGVDIGGGGDKTVFAIRNGKSVVDIISRSTYEADSILDELNKLCRRFRIDEIRIDATGIGYFVPEMCRNSGLNGNPKITGVNFGAKSPKDNCVNIRAFMYMRLRDWVRDGGRTGYNAELRKELNATECFFDGNSKLNLISKSKIVESIGHSPDEADAVALSCCQIDDFETVSEDGFRVVNLANMFEQASKWQPKKVSVW